MKRRLNSMVAIEPAEIFEDGDRIPMRPIILAGGENAERNRIAVIENMERIYGGKFSARIVYNWRNKQHLMRSLRRGGKWRGSPTIINGEVWNLDEKRSPKSCCRA